MVQRFYETTTSPFAISAQIASAGLFTEAAEFDYRRPFNLSVRGAFVATVTLQRSFDEGATWLDVWSTTEPAERGVHNFEPNLLWRIGCKPLQHTSGTVHLRLSH